MMTCEEVAWEVIRRLPDDMIIHRYDAFSTNSIYLKFDYGIANSLRISDHRGKKHLSYRYNILLDLDEITCEQGKFERWYYPPDKIDELVDKILERYEEVKSKSYNYEALVNWKKTQIDFSISFWREAKKVNKEDYL